MRTLKSGIFLIILFMPFLSIGQFWRLGGNPDFAGANGLISNSNYFGASGTADIRLGTGGVSQLFIGGTGYANPGFIGIGNNFLTPVNLLHLHESGGGVASMRLPLAEQEQQLATDWKWV